MSMCRYPQVCEPIRPVLEPVCQLPRGNSLQADHRKDESRQKPHPWDGFHVDNQDSHLRSAREVPWNTQTEMVS